MLRVSFPSFLLSAAFAIVAGVCLGENRVSAQNTEPVKLVTADGVRLQATFYPSEKKNAPTVLMLHPIGEGKSSKAQDWKNLAEALQKANYAVMTFDFRGHGDSTTIKDKMAFWSQQINVANVRSKEKDSIEVKDYIKTGNAYLPVLVNDIAAARAFLDARNDNEKDCNTSSLIVVGADNGATLGAVWMNAEWHRFKYSPPMGFPGLLPKFVEKRSEGKDVIAAVFLTVQPSLEKRTVTLSNLLKIPCKDNATAAAFFCGEDDAKALGLATKLASALKPKNSKEHDYIGEVKLPTNLSGIKLLQKSLNTDKYIVKYLDSVVEERREKQVNRAYLDSYYVWKEPSGKLVPAKNKKGAEVLNFSDYNKYAQ